jgi:hypothetical protein
MMNYYRFDLSNYTDYWQHRRCRAINSSRIESNIMQPAVWPYGFTVPGIERSICQMPVRVHSNCDTNGRNVSGDSPDVHNLCHHPASGYPMDEAKSLCKYCRLRMRRSWTDSRHQMEDAHFARLSIRILSQHVVHLSYPVRLSRLPYCGQHNAFRNWS